MLKSGIYYWEYSLRHLDTFPDPYYTNDVIIIDPIENKEFLNKVKILRELITTYCCLKDNDINEGKNQIISKIKDILLNTKNINYTEFVAYWKVLDTQYGTFTELENKDELLKNLLDKFCERRKEFYEKYGYTHTSVQALYDSGSSRSKGQKFKAKISDLARDILKDKFNLQFIEKSNWNNVKYRLNLDYKFGQTHQNKIPDFLIEYKNHIIIGEAKHIHNTGGAQDKQINELIEFINQKEENENIHYLSFLDGLYMYRFSQENLSDKLRKQKEDIEKYLKEYSENFFVNTEGLKKLLEDLKYE